jgi:predicted transcriptional regulator
MNVYFDPELLKQVESLSLRRKVSKSAIVEAAVASFLSGDSAEQLEAAMSRRLDRLGRQVDGLDEDLAVLGETLSLFIRFWLRRARRGLNGSRALCRASAGNWRRVTGS